MKQILSLLTFLFITPIMYGQDYKSQFENLSLDGDTLKQIELLQKWEVDRPKDPELYTSYFNYYFTMSKQEFLSMSTDQPDGESLQIQDSTGEAAGYLGSQTVYDQAILQKGLDKIDKGIKMFPNRLDMRFGKIYVLGLTKNWDEFTKEIVNTVRYSKKNNNQWTWTNNEKKENGKDFFLQSLQTYQLTLYDAENEDLFPNMRTIANEILKIYPNHIESLSNISITYLVSGDLDKGIEVLLKAEKIDPNDGIVLSNIAYAYLLKGDNNTAIEYYEKMLKLDDEKAVEFAQQQIESLKKSK